MKKIISIILTLAILLATATFSTSPVFATTSGTTGDCTWSLNGTVLTISGNGAMGNYDDYNKAPWGTSITEVIIEDGVTSIGEDAFWGCSSLTSVTIGNSVTSIGGWAFFDCSSLTSITIPDSVTSIGDYAFYDCDSLTKVNITDISAWYNIDFEESYSNPLNYAKNLYLNGELVTDLVIPDTVTKIKNYAFWGCSSLTSITIPDSVTSIGAGAFADCSSLTSITIPDSVTSIGEIAFSSCSSLTSVTIGNSVTSISVKAFLNCTSLTSVNIPSGVTSIGSYAFYSCSSLTSVNIPSGVTSIKTCAFEGCYKLKSVYITDITAWCNIDFGDNNHPLYYAQKLYLNNQLVTDLVMPDNVTSISQYAFSGCTSITKLSTGVSLVEGNTFNDCSNLKRIFFTKNLEMVYQNAFANCNSITDIYYEGTEEEWEEVTIQHNNGSLNQATVHFNCKGIPENSMGDINGDVNGDGKVDTVDLAVLKLYLAGALQ